MENMTKRLRVRVFAHLLSQSVAYFDEPQHSTGKLGVRLATDAANMRNVMPSTFGVYCLFLLHPSISVRY